MSDAMRLFTPAEAGAVSGLKIKAVNNAIDKQVVKPAKPVRPSPGQVRGPRRLLTGEDLVRLRVWYGVGETLSADKRLRLFHEIEAKPKAKTVRADDLLIVDVAEARKQVTARVRDLDLAEGLIEIDPLTLGGEPVFKGTRIPVYAIAAMLGAGADREEILSGYPKLDARKLDLCELWAAAHPRRGRPRRLADQGVKSTSTKRVVLKGDPLPKAAAVR